MHTHTGCNTTPRMLQASTPLGPTMGDSCQGAACAVAGDTAAERQQRGGSTCMSSQLCGDRALYSTPLQHSGPLGMRPKELQKGSPAACSHATCQQLPARHSAAAIGPRFWQPIDVDCALSRLRPHVCDSKSAQEEQRCVLPPGSCSVCCAAAPRSLRELWATLHPRVGDHDASKGHGRRRV